MKNAFCFGLPLFNGSGISGKGLDCESDTSETDARGDKILLEGINSDVCGHLSGIGTVIDADASHNASHNASGSGNGPRSRASAEFEVGQLRPPSRILCRSPSSSGRSKVW